jgi:hypothetical protein
MRQVWRTWLVCLMACVLVAGCLPPCLKRPDLPGCELGHLAKAHTLTDEEIVLTPQQVQRYAVINSGMGEALESDSADKDDPLCLTCLPGRKRARLARLLKGFAADEVRNKTAGAGLEAYYRLAESRLQIQLTVQGREIAERLVAQAEEMKKKGLTLPEDMTRLLRQKSEVAAEQVKLELLRDRLGEQIRQLADGKMRACRISTIETFHVVDEPINEDQAVAIALKYRAELNLLRAALCNLDSSTLPLIRQLMGGGHPLLGEKVRRCVPMFECLPRFAPFLARAEMERVTRELKTLICERERQAASEVRQAIRQIRASVQLAALAQEREQQARKHVAELEEKSARGLATDGELPRARRDHVKAKSDVLHEAITWEVARVELRKAQGLLVREVLGGDDTPPACLGTRERQRR